MFRILPFATNLTYLTSKPIHIALENCMTMTGCWTGPRQQTGYFGSGILGQESIPESNMESWNRTWWLGDDYDVSFPTCWGFQPFLEMECTFPFAGQPSSPNVQTTSNGGFAIVTACWCYFNGEHINKKNTIDHGHPWSITVFQVVVICWVLVSIHPISITIHQGIGWKNQSALLFHWRKIQPQCFLWCLWRVAAWREVLK